jgi:HD-like signal output (HDOD) protein
MEIVQGSEREHPLSRFERAVDELDSLQMIPAVAQRVVAMTSDPDCSLPDVDRAVSADAGLAARVLRLAGSPIFLARPPRTLSAAIGAIGMNDLRKLVLAASLPGAGAMRGFAGELWRHSLQTAHLAQLLSRKLRLIGGPDPFLCGLLHEVGTMALMRLVGNDYQRLLTRPGVDDQCKLERGLLGFDHADFGAIVAARWKLFPELEVIVQLHHEVDLADRLALPPATLHVARLVALSRTALAHPEAEHLPALAEVLGLGLDTIAKSVIEAAAMTQAVVGTLS